MEPHRNCCCLRSFSVQWRLERLNEGRTEHLRNMFRRPNNHICSVQYCAQQLCTVQCTHIWTDVQFSGVGFVSLGPVHCT